MNFGTIQPSADGQHHIFLGSEINDDAANTIIAQLLYISSQRTEDEIKMYINSPGGSVSAGLVIYDTMKFIPNEISTICTGIADEIIVNNKDK